MKIKNVVCYSFYLNDESPLAYLRLIGPLRRSEINVIYGIENNQVIINRVYEGDLVVIQREFPKEFDSYEKILEIAHKEGKPVIFDLDDLLLYLPENHPDRQSTVFGPSLLPMFQALMEADLVSVSTQKLRDVLAGYNDKVVVLPNYFDDNLWRLTPPILKNSPAEILTIGFMGTYSHKPDLGYITPVLLDLINRYPQKLRFHFYGAQPPASVGSLPQVRWTPWYSNSYKDFAEFFQTQSADIFIAPLVDNIFNRCKSPLKFFEYSALGAPGVFSRLDPYEGVVVHGSNGLLASSLAEWTDCLIQLIENDELRFQLATNAQTTIRENWLLSQNAFRWEETFQAISTSKSSNKEQNKDIVRIVKSINLQLFETFNKKEAAEHALSVQVAEKDQTVQTLLAQVAKQGQTIQTLSAQLSQASNEIEQSNVEVLQYILSRSWRLMRPFRMIQRKLKETFWRN